ITPLFNDQHHAIKSASMENKVFIIHGKQYTFKKELGSGGFGYVYNARRHVDNKQVAIKVVTLALKKAEKSYRNLESVLSEFRQTRKLTEMSDYIVHMFDCGFSAQHGVAYLVMELGQQDFGKYLLERPALTPVERKTIWRQFVAIAITLQNNHIVHRDIKPQNLIVFPGVKVKLCDFGIATQALERSERTGTYPYSAPEVTKPTPTTILTTKADVWSWGAVLYRMTYLVRPDYVAPCYYPPEGQLTTSEAQLFDILRHTLVKNPEKRASVSWLSKHAYTKTD
ncbi:unnamed protein product, partial [Adineta steineri]